MIWTIYILKIRGVMMKTSKYADQTVSKNQKLWIAKGIEKSGFELEELKVWGTAILSTGLTFFCLGVYLKAYLTLSLPGFGLMAFAVYLSEYQS